MPNTWFNYGQPLCISGIFFIIGSALFCFARGDGGADGRRPGSARAWGVLLMVVGGAPGLVIFLASPGPRARQALWDHVFRTPPERIERFVIQGAGPNEWRPLTPSQVVIEDAPRVRRIADVLRNAREFSPYRPRPMWIAHVAIVTREGTYHFTVEPTRPGGHNGTLVKLWSRPEGGGWCLGSARADGLETMLQEAVNSATTH
jgi:hypothetical protein